MRALVLSLLIVALLMAISSIGEAVEDVLESTMNTPMTSQNIHDLIRYARELREQLWKDPHRPRYHFIPPEGFFNDANGTIFWKGRYHLFYLAKTPVPQPSVGRPFFLERWLEIWDHASSRDLVNWIYHPPAIRPVADGSTPWGIASGDAMENAPEPTLIYHVFGQGTCISTSDDDELVRWTPHPDNPVIPEPKQPQEYLVFDPCGWYQDGTYYALIGSKNHRPGYEGDCTSLFKSNDLVNWEYRGPFYKSDRRWTDEAEDCACPDFFPLGDKHMLLKHSHRPHGQGYMDASYYLGRYENEQFYPELHGRMNWPGGQLCAPETLLDDKGRRIFFGWIREARRWEKHGWGSVMSLPRILSLRQDGTLGIEPVPELEALRFNPRHRENLTLSHDSDVDLPEVRGDCLELTLEIEPGDALEFGVKVRCSPGGEEQTAIVCEPGAGILKVNLEHSTLDEGVQYVRYHHFIAQDDPGGIAEEKKFARAQEAPFELHDGETLKLRIFLDRSVLEVFANGRQCITQRIYPTRSDSLGVRLFARGGSALVRRLEAWDMTPTNPW